MKMVLKKGKNGIYNRYIKRIIDFILALIVLLILFPFLVIVAVIGAIQMRGNPFFVQKRPGRNEKLFNLIKFRTMTNETDSNGNLLPSEKRITKYGRFLRKTSIDEIPELLNIIAGEMSIVGPRPLLVEYLPLYNDVQKHRHDVRPGLTGYAQAHGRNSISWEEKFEMDVWYTDNLCMRMDAKILFDTVISVLRQKGIEGNNKATVERFKGNEYGKENR